MCGTEAVGRGKWGVVFNEHKITVLQDEKVREIGCTAMWICLTKIKIANFMLWWNKNILPQLTKQQNRTRGKKLTDEINKNIIRWESCTPSLLVKDTEYKWYKYCDFLKNIQLHDLIMGIMKLHTLQNHLLKWLFFKFMYVCMYVCMYVFFLASLEYNCFTMVWQFLLYYKVNQLYIYIYLHISSLLCLPPTLPLTPLGGHKAPSWSPCAMQLLPTSYLFYIW